MTLEINHDRCSELLGGYVRGELAAAETQQVESHLAGCELCTSEARALSALHGPAPAALSELERAGMRRTVLADTGAGPGSGFEPHRATDQRRAKLFPLLGAAALIAALAVFAYTATGGVGGGDSEQATTSDRGGFQGEAERADDAGADEDGSRDPAPQLQKSSTADAAGSAEAAGPAAGRAAPPRPTFRAAMGEVDRKDLNHLGRRGLSLIAFSRAFQVRDVGRLRDEFVEELAEAAPSARGAQIRECVAAIASNFPTALPAYSGIGDYTERPQREVLIVAFTWTHESEGPLDQSMVWAWPLGTCNQVAHYSKNLIRPRR